MKAKKLGRLDQTAADSFPCSDPPSWVPVTGVQDSLAKAYNYEHFSVKHYGLTEFCGPRPYRPEPFDFSAAYLDGTNVNLSDFRGKKVVVETASLTCPDYQKHIVYFNRLAAKFPQVVFLVLYVREAHPGEFVPAHKTCRDKNRRATTLVKQLAEKRPIIVDNLTGDAHRALGAFPNMVYIFDEQGMVVHKRSRADADEVNLVLCGLTPNRKKYDDGFIPPFELNLENNIRILTKGGLVASWDFLRAAPRLYKMQKKIRDKQVHKKESFDVASHKVM